MSEFEVVKGFSLKDDKEGRYDYNYLLNKPGRTSKEADGLAPQLSGKQSTFLRGDGEWAEIPVYKDATTDESGLMSAEDKKRVDSIETIILNSIEDKADIIEKICGSIITLDNSADTPVQGLKVYGKTIQNGTPTPDTPVSLESAGDGDNVSVTVTGKNLFGGDAFADKILTEIQYSKKNETDRTITFSGAYAKDKVLFDQFKPDTQYTIILHGKNTLGNYTNLRFKYTDGTASNALNFTTQNDEQYLVFTTPSDKSVLSFIGIYYSGEASFYYDKCGIFEGVLTAEDFASYNGQSLTIQKPTDVPVFLPGIPVSSGGNYTDANGQQWVCDEVDFERGKYIQRIETKKLTGSGWILNGYESNNIAHYRFPVQSVPSSAVFSTILTYYANAGASNGSFVNVARISNSGSSIVCDVSAIDFPTVQSWASYLDSNPMTIQYTLAIPIEHDLSAEELAQYATLHTNYPDTTVFNDVGVDMKVSYATLNTALPITGGRMNGPIDMRNNPISGVPNPNKESDVVNKKYVDNIDEKVNTLGQTVNNVQIVADEANKKVDTLRDIVSKFHSSIVEEASGEIITLDGASNAELAELKVYGKTTQKTTTGKNLLSAQQMYSQFGDYLETTLDNRNCVRITSGAQKIITPSFLKPNTQYTVSMLCKNVLRDNYSSSIGNMLIRFWYDDGTRSDLVNARAESDWIKCQLTSDAGKTVVSIGSASYDNRSYTYIDIDTFQFEEGAAATEYERYTGGIPSPNPEYPQPLESAGDGGSVDVIVTGKNLCPGVKKGGYDDTNGIFNNSYSPYYCTEKIIIEPRTRYNVSSPDPVSSLVSHYWDVDGNWLGKFIVSAPTPDTAKYMAVNAETSNAIRLQIEKGEIKTEFEPYNSQSLTIQKPTDTPVFLPGIPVSSDGNYIDKNGQQWVCDEVDFASGKYVQRVDVCTLNGNEANWSLYNSVNGFTLLLTSMKKSKYGSAWCSHLPISKSLTQDGLVVGFDNNYLYFVNANTLFGVSTVAELKTYLSANPLTVIYELAIPIETPLSAEELAQYAALHTNYPNTTIFNDAGAGMEVKYIADTKMYIDKKFAELADAILNNI